MVKVKRIQRMMDSNGKWFLRAYLDNCTTQIFGDSMTEIGSKRMLTKRAKQFNLKVNGDVAE